MLDWVMTARGAICKAGLTFSLALCVNIIGSHSGQAAHYRHLRAHYFAHQTRDLAQVSALPAAWLTPDPEKDAALVVDGFTGRALYQRSATQIRHPASLTKMMTLYLLFDALKTHRVSLDTLLPVSAHAAAQKPTKLALRPGDSIPVDIAIKAIVVRSANDVAVTIAEALGGSEYRFAQMMTAKAHELGMYNTYYQNASGLPDPGQLTTASDLAVLARHLAYDDPQYYHYFSTIGFSWRGIPYVTHNNLIGKYEGADGIKTGYTGASGFNLVSSVVRNGNHIIGVVMGGRTAHSRDRDMIAMLDSTFARINANPMMVARANVPWQTAAQNASSQPVVAGFDVAMASRTTNGTTQTPAPGKFSLLAALTPRPREIPKYPDETPQQVPSYPDQDTHALPNYPQDEDSAETKAVTAPTATSSSRSAALTVPPAISPVIKQSQSQAMPRLALVQVPIPRLAPQPSSQLATTPSLQDIALAQVPLPKLAPQHMPASPKLAMLDPKPSAVAIARARRNDIGEGDVADDPKANAKTGSWSVQIGAFADTASAKNRLTDFASKSPDILAHAQRLVVPLRSPKGKLLYRARFGSFAESAARETCVKMMERGQPCFAVAAR